MLIFFWITNKEVSSSSRKIKDFKMQVVINNSLYRILANTSASISVCGIKEALKWNLIKRMRETMQQSYDTSHQYMLILVSAR